MLGGVRCAHQVVTPTLAVYLPEVEPNGMAVAILPAADLPQALRLLRARQSQLVFRAEKFGGLGFSADWLARLGSGR